ncbi:hypothetical protein [Methylobacterium sp. yr596]|uniref:hypothetical protein n=1 Tax=Methylobacterium sp. yr596 TaxID=1761800 RepID=UPI001587ACA6|nr:hypothetical protein [Methylobacterium sp. yr596]
MPSALTNSRHELFAQELAKGKSQFEAHAAAGYSAHRGNASALAQDKSIQARVAEIQSATAEMERAATQAAAEALAIDREWVMARLQENALKAALTEDYGPSNRALELLGKELGMFKDKIEHSGPNGGPIQTEQTTARELLASKLARLTGSDGASIPAGKPH